MLFIVFEIYIWYIFAINYKKYKYLCPCESVVCVRGIDIGYTTLKFEIHVTQNCIHFLIHRLAFPVEPLFYLVVLIQAELKVSCVVSSSDFCSLAAPKQGLPYQKKDAIYGQHVELDNHQCSCAKILHDFYIFCNPIIILYCYTCFRWWCHTVTSCPVLPGRVRNNFNHRSLYTLWDGFASRYPEQTQGWNSNHNPKARFMYSWCYQGHGVLRYVY